MKFNDMNSDTKDALKVVGYLLFFVALLIGFIVGGVNSMLYLECLGFRTTGYETTYSWGCYVKVNGAWIPKQYVFGDAKELRLKEKK